MIGYNIEESKMTAFCPLPFTKLLVNAWGDVFMCCHHPGNSKLGNVKQHNLLKLWRSEKAKLTRDQTKKGKLAPICHQAPNCPFKLKEKVPFEFPMNIDFPRDIEIDLPDKHCNIGGENPTPDTACIMCVRSHSFNPNQPDITDLICEQVRPLMPYIKKFCVLGIAEPFWKDAVFDVFEKVNYKKYKDNILFETNHNVTCFGERSQSRFVNEVAQSNLQFSLDAATPDTYVKIRRLDAYDLCIKNLKLWLSARTDKHKVTIWNNINMINLHEMTGMVQTAIDLGVDSIYMLPTQNQNKMVNLGDLTINSKNVDLFEKHSCDAMHLARLNGMDLRYVQPFNVAPKQDCLIQIDSN